MKSNLGKVFSYYFPNSFEMYIAGVTIIVISLPGLGMTLIHRDDVFPTMFSKWRDIGIVWGCGTFLIGLALIFCGVRQSSRPGTTTYRFTHPWGV
jgi:hypothetical protein